MRLQAAPVFTSLPEDGEYSLYFTSEAYKVIESRTEWSIYKELIHH